VTPKNLLEQLLAARKGTETFRLRILAEETLTPRELVALAREPLPRDLRAWVKSLLSLSGFGWWRAPQAYLRQIISPDVELFLDPLIPPAQKTLLIGCTGGAGRLMMPIPSVLQYLPSSAYDVVILKDRSGQLFDAGIAGYADGLTELAGRLAADLRPGSYRRCVTYGTSSGGFAALRLGLLLRAERAISIGGRFTWHVRRILDGRPVSPFDMLCACIGPSPTRLICVYGARMEEDRRAAEALLRCVRGEAMPIRRVGGHNVIHELWKKGRLRRFYRQVLGEGG
jgi:hypothetical protein